MFSVCTFMITFIMQPIVQSTMCTSAYQNPQLMTPIPQIDPFCQKGVTIAVLSTGVAITEQSTIPNIAPLMEYGTCVEMNSRPPIAVSVNDKTKKRSGITIHL